MLNNEVHALRRAHTSTSKSRSKVSDFFLKLWAFRASYLFIAPFMICFIVFILIPVLCAIVLSFMYYNALEAPRFIGWDNFRYMLSQDLILIKYALPNTISFALIIGPGGYICAFMLAWLISILPGIYRKWFTLALYTPSLAGLVAMSIIWTPLLSSDRLGYLNSFLLNLGLISEPVLWATSKEHLMNSMIVVTLWKSMGIGFLAMLAGILNVNPELYEAGRLDGIRSRLEEIWYITIPSTKPQMLFGAVMAIVGAIQSSGIGAALSGMNPTPQYAGHMIVSQIDDYGFKRFELGYATALSVILLLIVFFANKFANKLFGTKEGE
ncbi:MULTISPECIES: carbohydrate ABC transporter permease [Paenibacillus]|uniref:Sugar ABC transporter permease n=1 Tax=Paenibacillus radicis (ex Xue et al. 2023) TaxID=2972489 RepID=A0ABT1YDH3_9BACL|nr:sugar ABC transporter permease [Paenibacillus radicis (ex Xue et al. 2023)]MCR8631246.1 sugar ABC transporter permease [Paenibacillus radicis (ex Xue et al. 2023)]